MLYSIIPYISQPTGGFAAQLTIIVDGIFKHYIKASTFKKSQGTFASSHSSETLQHVATKHGSNGPEALMVVMTDTLPETNSHSHWK